MTASRTLPPLVRIEKIAATADANFSAGDVETFAYGLPNATMSLPVNYSMIGWMIGAPRIGDRVFLLRVCRNDVRCMGVFTSSLVTAVELTMFRTQNSIYRWRELRADELDVFSAISPN